jgi:hypothetical protein
MLSVAWLAGWLAGKPGRTTERPSAAWAGSPERQDSAARDAGGGRRCHGGAVAISWACGAQAGAGPTCPLCNRRVTDRPLPCVGCYLYPCSACLVAACCVCSLSLPQLCLFQAGSKTEAETEAAK